MIRGPCYTFFDSDARRVDGRGWQMTRLIGPRFKAVAAFIRFNQSPERRGFSLCAAIIA